jgi:hypothetical protein
MEVHTFAHEEIHITTDQPCLHMITLLYVSLHVPQCMYLPQM